MTQFYSHMIEIDYIFESQYSIHAFYENLSCNYAAYFKSFYELLLPLKPAVIRNYEKKSQHSSMLSSVFA